MKIVWSSWSSAVVFPKRPTKIELRTYQSTPAAIGFLDFSMIFAGFSDACRRRLIKFSTHKHGALLFPSLSLHSISDSLLLRRLIVDWLVVELISNAADKSRKRAAADVAAHEQKVAAQRAASDLDSIDMPKSIMMSLRPL